MQLLVSQTGHQPPPKQRRVRPLATSASSSIPNNLASRFAGSPGLFEKLARYEPCFWANPNRGRGAALLEELPLKTPDLARGAQMWDRLAPLLQRLG